MLQDITSMDRDHEPHSADYDRVRTAIAFISREWRRQPSLDEIAGAVGISASHLHAVFRRWSGLSPKSFLQAVTLDHARRLLKSDAPLLDASLELGLSGPGRLHDLFVTHEAMSPGEWKTGGAGLTLSYGFHPSPFGEALAVVTEHGLAGIGFVDEGDRAAALADMTRRWPKATFVENAGLTGPAVERAFTPDLWRKGQPLKIVMIGSDFEIRVWRALLSIPFGRLTTYGDLAQTIGQPKAARAVGAAVGRNPISFVVPCHRVIGKSGTLTGYHWGLSRKQAILGWEACQLVGT
ncbi:MAG: bifunctional helix-turn-helix domain-containing protein/methylated-DNA--[protein]-cysteine S-methyltransferase [Alphaproteobacteria bacterium]